MYHFGGNMKYKILALLCCTALLVGCSKVAPADAKTSLAEPIPEDVVEDTETVSGNTVEAAEPVSNTVLDALKATGYDVTMFSDLDAGIVLRINDKDNLSKSGNILIISDENSLTKDSALSAYATPSPYDEQVSKTDTCTVMKNDYYTMYYWYPTDKICFTVSDYGDGNAFSQDEMTAIFDILATCTNDTSYDKEAFMSTWKDAPISPEDARTAFTDAGYKFTMYDATGTAFYGTISKDNSSVTATISLGVDKHKADSFSNAKLTWKQDYEFDKANQEIDEHDNYYIYTNSNHYWYQAYRANGNLYIMSSSDKDAKEVLDIFLALGGDWEDVEPTVSLTPIVPEEPSEEITEEVETESEEVETESEE